MKKVSAGLLMYRKRAQELEFFLVHPGGPFWAKKDLECWSIPKGERDEGEEDFLKVARREFTEETSWETPEVFIELSEVTQKSGKVIHAWAFEDQLPERDLSTLISNTCETEWPPRSGKKIEIPEVDRGEYFTLAEARERIYPSQVALLEELVDKVNTV